MDQNVPLVSDALVDSVIHHESGGDPNAVSKVGAVGLMQLMPQTAKELGVTNRFDPEQNKNAGRLYLSKLVHKYNDLEKALIAYNWGPGNVDKHGLEHAPESSKTYAKNIINRAYSGKSQEHHADISKPEIVPTKEVPEQKQPGTLEMLENLAKSELPDFSKMMPKAQAEEKEQPEKPIISQYGREAPKEGYLTKLNPAQEKRFQAWAQKNNVHYEDSPNSDYDMRGFWLDMTTGGKHHQTGTNKNDNKPHFTDYYKTPYHKSFSRESKWAKPNAPKWNMKDQLVDDAGNVVFDERKEARK